MSRYSRTTAAEPEGCEVGEVYVLHLEPPFRHARHYIGWARDSARRIREHELGLASAGKLPAAAVAAGCTLRVAAIVPGSRWTERKLKNRGGAARVCPICTGRPVSLPRARAEA